MAAPLWLKLSRLSLLLIAVGLLVWAYSREAHEVARYDGGEARSLEAVEYVEGLTIDGYLRDNDILFDIYSNAPESVQIRDCHT